MVMVMVMVVMVVPCIESCSQAGLCSIPVSGLVIEAREQTFCKISFLFSNIICISLGIEYYWGSRRDLLQDMDYDGWGRWGLRMVKMILSSQVLQLQYLNDVHELLMVLIKLLWKWKEWNSPSPKLLLKWKRNETDPRQLLLKWKKNETDALQNYFENERIETDPLQLHWKWKEWNWPSPRGVQDTPAAE